MKLPLWPQSLFGRLLSASLAVIGATLIVIVVLIVRERRELLFWGSETAAIVEAIEATSGSLADLPQDARTEELERLRASPLSSTATPSRGGRRRNRISPQPQRRCGRGSRVSCRQGSTLPCVRRIVRPPG